MSSTIIISIVVVVVVVLLFVVFNTHQKEQSVPQQVVGERVYGNGMASQLGYPTVNVVVKPLIPAGMYVADTKYGKAVILVVRKEWECHYLQWNPEIDKMQHLTYFNIRRLPSSAGSIVDVFNRGAKTF